MQAFTEEHSKPPPPVQGSLKDIFTETFRAFVKGVKAVIFAVGGTVSAKLTYSINQPRDNENMRCIIATKS